MRTPLVSVITIFRNEERFLPEAVESVLAQSYRNWELLLCDDGSTDESPALAREYARSHRGRVRYLQHPGGAHRGMSATRNLGLAHARGELIAFLDGDDTYMPDKIARQVEFLQHHPEAVMVYGPTCFWHEWPGRPPHDQADSHSRVPVAKDRLLDGSFVLRQVLRGKAEPPATCSVLVRREAMETIGAFEDRFHDLFEDQVFFAKLLTAGRVFVTRECHDRYRQHPDSSSAVAERAGRYHPDRSSPTRLRYLEWLHSYLDSVPVDHGLRRLVDRELWLARRPALARVRSAARKAAAGLAAVALAGAFAAGRLLLPRPLRHRLWNLWVRRHGGTNSLPPGA